MTSNTQAQFESYIDRRDVENLDISPNLPIQPEEPKSIIQPVSIRYKKAALIRIIMFGVFVLIAALVYILIFTDWIPMSFSNKLIKKYENKAKSQFTNKDQVEFDNENDYDIHYLVEQMIYKEFSPKDKKKYLNLPEALKNSLLIDYLIEKI